MKRTYAFEAEEMAPEVKAQLEKVEEVVDEKCTTPEDCEKVLDKIEGQEKKFNDALDAVATAAEDCKDGKCDKADLNKVMQPKMAELKEVAKTIGVATEGDTVTEGELEKAKAYLEGAREIVENKLEEVKDGTEAPAEKGDDDDSAEDEDATESFTAFIAACESLKITGRGSSAMESSLPFMFQ